MVQESLLLTKILQIELKQTGLDDTLDSENKDVRFLILLTIIL